jgi:hypothetical protein
MMHRTAKRSVFEPSPAKQPVFEPSPMEGVDEDAFYNDGSCYYGMGDEDFLDNEGLNYYGMEDETGFNSGDLYCSGYGMEAAFDIGDFCHSDYYMEDIEDDSSVDNFFFCNGLDLMDIQNALPDGDFHFQSGLSSGGTSLKKWK